MSDNERQIGFDWSMGIAAKRAGLDSIEANNPRFVDLMRAKAMEIALAKGSVTSDDLRRYAKVNAIVPDHPNAWGAIFRGNDWKEVGRMKSKLISNHSREIRVWALAGP